MLLLLHESILIGTLAGDKDYVSLLAIGRIIKTWKTINSLRNCKLPEVKFETKDYIDVINWAEMTVTESPLTNFLHHKIVTKFILHSMAVDDVILPNIKFCHN